MKMSPAGTRALLLMMLAACNASQGAFQHGHERAMNGDWDAAVDYFERALRQEPENIEYRIALQRASLQAQHHHLMLARKHLAADDRESAVEELGRALDYGPHPYAEEQLRELRQDRLWRVEQVLVSPGLRVGQPMLDPASQVPLHLKFAEDTSLRKILETLAQLAGVNILFDEAFRDRQVTVELDDVTFEEALDVLTRTNGLFYKVSGSSTVTISREELQ